MFDLYTTDHGLICNGDDTYRCAALDVINRGHVVLNWTDRFGSALNILLSYAPTRVGSPSGLIDSHPGKLWVGVAGLGCYAFDVRSAYLHPDYIAEKLGVRGTTASALATLLTEIRVAIAKAEK